MRTFWSGSKVGSWAYTYFMSDPIFHIFWTVTLNRVLGSSRYISVRVSVYRLQIQFQQDPWSGYEHWWAVGAGTLPMGTPEDCLTSRTSQGSNLRPSDIWHFMWSRRGLTLYPLCHPDPVFTPVIWSWMLGTAMWNEFCFLASPGFRPIAKNTGKVPSEPNQMHVSL